jgi:hypothetical protein
MNVKGKALQKKDADDGVEYFDGNFQGRDNRSHGMVCVYR